MDRIYLIPDRNNIEKSLKLAKEYHTHFEYNDFCMPAVLDNENKIQELVSFYKGLVRDRSHDTLHGAFLDVTIHSSDSLIRKASEYRVRQCMDIADSLGIRGVVFHTNLIPNFRVDYYRKGWLDCNVKFWKQILEEYPRLSVFVENMFDEETDSLLALAEQMKEHERFGICFDYAHAMVFGENVENWVKDFAPYIKHMHINDNDLQDDLHQSVGVGKIDWDYFTKLLKKENVNSTVLIEIKNLEKQKESLEYMQQNNIYPLVL